METVQITLILSVLLVPMLAYGSGATGHKYIIVAALEQETANAGLEQYAPVVYTGVGKVNAAINLYDAILKYQPDLVINYGTAGSLLGPKRSLGLEATFADLGPDLAPCSMKAAHHGADGNVEDIGCFLIGEAVEVDQFHNLAKVRTELGEGVLHR